MPRKAIEPDVGVSKPARHDSTLSCRSPLGPSTTTSSPSSASNESWSRGSYHVAPRGELHREIVDRGMVAHPNAVAGSAPVTRRSAVTLATTPTATAMSGQDERGRRA